MRFLYAHGFASSPQSRKAQVFHQAFAVRGITLEIPALDGGDFEHLTISGQLSIIRHTLEGEPACLIGSSMGGYLAALYAATHPEVARVVLMAPAFHFAQRWLEKAPVGEPLDVYHYGQKQNQSVHYHLLEEATEYPADPDFRQPSLIFHGIHDGVVPVDYSRQFAAGHPNAELREMDSDHELLNVLETITDQALPFLIR